NIGGAHRFAWIKFEMSFGRSSPTEERVQGCLPKSMDRKNPLRFYVCSGFNAERLERQFSCISNTFDFDSVNRIPLKVTMHLGVATLCAEFRDFALLFRRKALSLIDQPIGIPSCSLEQLITSQLREGLFSLAPRTACILCRFFD